jgi:hypothetical protein
LGVEAATPTNLASYYSTQRKPAAVPGLNPSGQATTSPRASPRPSATAAAAGMNYPPHPSSISSITSASTDSTTQDRVLKRTSETGSATGLVVNSGADTSSVGSGSTNRRKRSSIFGNFRAAVRGQSSPTQQNSTQPTPTRSSFVLKGFRPGDGSGPGKV